MVPSTGCVDSDIVELRFEVQRKFWKAPVYLPGRQSNVGITGEFAGTLEIRGKVLFWE